jgi:CheY-like chemotaxis protein
MATILVIEDNLANMKLACLLLRKAGHAVLCAADAETGLTLARTDQPDLILMDVQLPGMDGLAATALLKGDPATAAIPVIALTAMAMKADQEKTRVAGCDGYIAKPLRYQELYAAIDALLDEPSPPAPGAASALPSPAVHPPVSGPPVAAPGPSLNDEARRNGRLILVAEDNETNQKIIRRQLALLGHGADIVDNGRLALQLWRTGGYALLLTDLQMPEMDGYELIEAIRAEEAGARHLPIVVMTASSSMRVAHREQPAEMDDYLNKPLQLAELRTTLDAWLPGAASPLPHCDGPARRAAGVEAVDVQVLERLVGNDPAVVLEFLTDFRSSAERMAAQLQADCAADRPPQAAGHAHKLMSAARAVGALALGELCAKLEIAGQSGRLDALATLMPLFEEEFAAVIAFIASFQAPRVAGHLGQ